MSARPLLPASLPGDDAGPTDTHDEDDAVPHTITRLAAEFSGRPVAVVSATVLRCRRELDAVPPGALPELLERLARQRLRSSA
ncbi:hypothetical protein [Actinomycetospora straminea]|uniref:Uncharacterized protein n=1 Tax=Actinomycetospora straminea TaxID=663607 RepID=A0ABP9EKR3_9PSEU|nr:hypothetical protein [Actinomycetospora straminea]MDD7933159.1 hypothetical protein [Actinomycetospora straminea]